MKELYSGLTQDKKMSYKVTLEVFEGPLDLLLYLIKKEEILKKEPRYKIFKENLKNFVMNKNPFLNYNLRSGAFYARNGH